MRGPFLMATNRLADATGSFPSRSELTFWSAASGPLDERSAWRPETWATFHDALSRDVGSRRRSHGETGASPRDVVLFVHGHERAFGEAALRYGRLCASLPDSGPYASAVLFAWPSDAVDADSVLALLAVEESAPDLADLMAALIDALRGAPDSEGARLSVVAHGLGAHLVQKAGASIRDGAARSSVEDAVGRLVLAAPDVDDDLFGPGSGKGHDEGRALARLAQRVIVLFSPEDEVLARVSALRPLHRPRLGLVGAADPDVLPANVSQVATEGRHGDYFDSPRVAERLRAALGCGPARHARILDED